LANSSTSVSDVRAPEAIAASAAVFMAPRPESADARTQPVFRASGVSLMSAFWARRCVAGSSPSAILAISSQSATEARSCSRRSVSSISESASRRSDSSRKLLRTMARKRRASGSSSDARGSREIVAIAQSDHPADRRAAASRRSEKLAVSSSLVERARSSDTLSHPLRLAPKGAIHPAMASASGFDAFWLATLSTSPDERGERRSSALPSVRTMAATSARSGAGSLPTSIARSRAVTTRAVAGLPDGACMRSSADVARSTGWPAASVALRRTRPSSSRAPEQTLIPKR
jgi:hypothetical protein